MKTLLNTTLLVACVSLQHLSAQPASPPPPPPLDPVTPAVGESHVEEIIRGASRSANEAVRSALKTAQAAVAEAGRASGKAYEAAVFQFGAGARSSSRSLAILTHDVDSEKVDDIEEDLSVMARILQKAARSLRDDDRFKAMGIDLDSSVFGSASGARNLYLEGHGAIFLLSVKYPLVGPGEDAATPTTEPAADTEWERAKEEVLGHGRNNHDSENVFSARSGRVKLEPYDEGRVDALKSALLDALKNASNIRHVSRDETVTIVVQGGEGVDTIIHSAGIPGGTVRAEVRVRKEIRTNGNTITLRRSGNIGETVMTIRVAKSDIDALAAGKLTADEFRKKASIHAYLRRGETDNRSMR